MAVARLERMRAIVHRARRAHDGEPARTRSKLMAVMSTTATAAPPRVSWEGETAWKNALRGTHSRWFAERRSRQWPGTAASRLEAGVVLPEVRPSFQLARTDAIFTVGSCF